MDDNSLTTRFVGAAALAESSGIATLDVLDRDPEPAIIGEALEAEPAPVPALDVSLSAEQHGRMTVLMPTRGRPRNMSRIADAWRSTNAVEQGARLVLVADSDDPTIGRYFLPAIDGVEDWWTIWINDVDHPGPGVSNMAGKTNEAARDYAAEGAAVLAFQNDDHVPETEGWVGLYLNELDRLTEARGVGVVYGNDGLRGESLCTEFAVTASWVRTLGRLFPALVGHQYTDTSVRDLARAVECLTYLPEVRITHKHPTADGGDGWDETSRSANSRAQREGDRVVYDRWSARPALSRAAGLASQAGLLRALRP